MYLVNVEPTVEELLNDPIAHLLMARDGLQPEFVWACVNDARLKLSGRGAEARKADVVAPT
jgi:hypothetical protein